MSRISVRLFLSIVGGALITIGVFVMVLVTDLNGCGSGKPLVERHPFAWVLTWPLLLKPVNRLGEVVIIGNVLLYSSLIYFVLYRRSRPIKLP